mgnify:CR=1 FL=1
MKDTMAIIFAYQRSEQMKALTEMRSLPSVPFGGRYRIIDFALSNIVNSGITKVGIITRNSYQSLMDHLGSGKPWDMSRKDGGLRMLPPFGLPEYHTGAYTGTVEALNAVGTYIRDIHEKYVIMMHGNMAASIDRSAVVSRSIRTRKKLRSSFSFTDSFTHWASATVIGSS